MTAILGLSAYYHDSAAALVVDGRIVAAAQEERFTRRKHDERFPGNAVAYCLAEARLRPEELDYVVFYEKPLTKFERLMETFAAVAPSGFGAFCRAAPTWAREKLFLRRAITRGLGASPRNPLVFLEHHESHAASAFFPSPFEEAAILTLDGVGEWATTCLGVGRGNRLELTQQITFPHSIGLLYSAFTHYCGFKVNSGEYKLMGLAPYGKPIYQEAILRHLIDLRADGSLWLNMDYFGYLDGSSMTNCRFHRLFGGPPRQAESRILQRHMDLAASIQAVTEEAVLRMAEQAHRSTRCKALVMAGGVALNCVANGRLAREGPFDRIWVQPAAGDAGGAVGAALFVWYQLLGKPRESNPEDDQQGSLLGPAFSNHEVRRYLHHSEAVFEECSSEDELLEATAEMLAEGKVVGWFQGRMEFGPRALGSRSILGDPRSPAMQTTMNTKIKFRESFRPFAPIVLAERAHEWFDLPRSMDSPYMLMTAPVLARHRTASSIRDGQVLAEDPDLCRRVNVVRSTIPAVTHVDHSARLQTVSVSRSPRLHGLLETFARRTGCPVLVNTSFNVRGEPIVCTPADAYRCFLATEMDAVVLENCIVRRVDGRVSTSQAERERHLAQFALD